MNLKQIIENNQKIDSVVSASIPFENHSEIAIGMLLFFDEEKKTIFCASYEWNLSKAKCGIFCVSESRRFFYGSLLFMRRYAVGLLQKQFTFYTYVITDSVPWIRLIPRNIKKAPNTQFCW